MVTTNIHLFSCWSKLTVPSCTLLIKRKTWHYCFQKKQGEKTSQKWSCLLVSLECCLISLFLDCIRYFLGQIRQIKNVKCTSNQFYRNIVSVPLILLIIMIIIVIYKHLWSHPHFTKKRINRVNKVGQLDTYLLYNKKTQNQLFVSQIRESKSKWADFWSRIW